MSEARMDDATRAQVAAADPAGSVWLSANAGSGKTRVLTDRVAWLLLDGTPPDRILCLTFTKAAAGEMQNRLFERLGEWALLPDDALREALRRLGVRTAAITPEALRRARTLFAGAIETPGGLKIQTIHAFCASLLRRFPLEAGVSPGFREMDDIAARRLVAEVLDAMAADPGDAPVAEALFRQLTDDDRFFDTLTGLRAKLDGGATEADLRAVLGVADSDERAVLRDAIGPGEVAAMTAFADAARAAPGKKMDDLRDLLADAARPNAEAPFETACKAFLTQKLEPKKCPLTKAAEAAYGDDAAEDWAAVCEHLLAVKDRLRGVQALARARTLHEFAPRFLARLAAEKQARGWLDFTDQILHARRLLSDPATAQWVLWKLDGGIDHVLVDEAQDTAPEQWDVIEPLVEAFGDGQGARDVDRTLFVVGDLKQSIYSFQGADPDVFGAMRRRLGAKLTGGVPLQDHALRHSFRSAPAILRVVDRVFADPSGAGGATEHIAFQDRKPGRVDLWPHVPVPEKPEGRIWFDPVDRPASNDAPVVLAGRIASAVKAMIDDRVPIELREGGATVRRPVEARDVLILVRGRQDALFGAILRKCKEAGLDLAGADRLRLAEELAVRDRLALCRVAAAPEDDLSLATVLRSPLMGLSEWDRDGLGQPRPGYLWRALHAHGGFGQAAALLDDVMAQADFLRPYELLQRVLIRHDGRRRLLGRLGPEVAEAIDGLLHQALAYEQLETPSLTGFLGWIEEADIEIKREGVGGAIRVMTIHGAKGLEAPVVILPHCGTWQDRAAPALLAPRGGPVLWKPPKEECNAALREAADAHVARQAEERDRLLYVGLTRAESWLICASAGAEPDDRSWAARLRGALMAEGAAAHPFEGGEGLRLEEGDWTTPAEAAAATARDDVPADGWEETPPAPVAAVPDPASPSDLGGAKALPGEHADLLDRDAAMRHGNRVHALLEHLPPLPPERRAEAASTVIARHAEPRDGDDWEAAVAEAAGVMATHPDIFGPDGLAEVPFVLPAEGDRPALSGTMDRILVTPDAVRVVDYKTNRTVPGGPGAVPDGILRQMGAYAAACAAIWPDRRVEPAVLWTATGDLMAIPADLARAAWDGAPARTSPAREAD